MFRRAEEQQESGYAVPNRVNRALLKCTGTHLPQDPTLDGPFLPSHQFRGKQAKPHLQPTRLLFQPFPQQHQPRHRSLQLTLCHHLAKDRQGVQCGTVPAAVSELVLALLNGQLGPAPHRVHHLQVPLAHLHLPLDQALQLLTGLLLRDAPN